MNKGSSHLSDEDISSPPMQRQFSLDKIREGTSSPLFQSLSLLEQVSFEEQVSLWKSVFKSEEMLDTNEVDHNLQSNCLWCVQE